MDADGYFYFADRKKQAIRRRGENISSFEVEAVVDSHPAVLECCVVGVPSEVGEEEVKAVVVLKPECAGIAGEDILSWARTRMAAYKAPRLIQFVDALPRTGSGKLMWRALQAKEFR